jgi:hypothetical protein
VTRRYAAVWGFAAFVVVAAVARIGQYNAPLAGDATQFLYVGETVVNGGMPYVDAAYSKGPLTALLFAVIDPVAGTSPAAVRLTLVPFAALAALALAAYVAHYAGRRAGALAGLLFAAYSAIPVIEGAEAKTEEYAVAPMLGALWLATRRSGLAVAGAGGLVACAMLFNPALAVVLPAVLFELLYGARGDWARRLGAMAAGAAVPVVAAFAWLAAGGALDDMLTQVGGQIRDSLGAGSGSGPAMARWPGALVVLATSGPPLRVAGLWVLAALACVLAMRERRLRRPAIAMALLMGAVLVRVQAPVYEIDYQYYPAVPAMCGALALGVTAVWPPRLAARIAIALVLAVPLWILAVEPQLDLLGKDPRSRNPYGAAVYPVAAYLRSHTAPDDRIVVEGARAEVYWRAERRAPDRFFDVFSRAGDSSYPAERARDLARDPPAAIVVMSTEKLTEDRVLEQLVASGRYVEAHNRAGSRVWLRRPRAGARRHPPGASRSGSPGRA